MNKMLFLGGLSAHLIELVPCSDCHGYSNFLSSLMNTTVQNATEPWYVQVQLSVLTNSKKVEKLLS